jgi:hypothetical protein
MKSLNGAHQEVKSNNNEEKEMNNLVNEVKDVCVVELSDNLKSVSDDFLGVIGVDIKPTIKLVRTKDILREDIFRMFEKWESGGHANMPTSVPSGKYFYTKKLEDVFEKSFMKDTHRLNFCENVEYSFMEITIPDEENSKRKVFANNFAELQTYCIKYYEQNENYILPETFRIEEEIKFSIKEDYKLNEIEVNAEVLRDKEKLKDILLNNDGFKDPIELLLEERRIGQRGEIRLDSLSIHLNRLPVGEDMETRKLSVIK